MKNIPTAEEFLENHYKKIREHFLTFHNGNYDSYEEYNKSNPLKTLQECMIEFAKLHVQAALEAASDNACITYEGFRFAGRDIVDKESIQEAYPLDLIK